MSEGNGQNGNGSNGAGQVVSLEHPKKFAFLKAFSESGNVLQACKSAEVGRTSHYNWLHSDPDYVVAFEVAKQDAIDVLEAEAQRRAVDGMREYQYHCGKPVVDQDGNHVYKQTYSDLLLIFLLKGLRPEKYRERYDVSGDMELRMGDHRKMLDQVTGDDELKGLMRATQARMRMLQNTEPSNGSNGSNGNNNGGGSDD